MKQLIAQPAERRPAASSRRQFLIAGPAMGAALALPSAPVRAQSGARERWCATWGAAPAGPPPSGNVQSYSNQTLRLIARASIGGNRVRIRVSNEMGTAPLRIGRASIGLRGYQAGIASGSLRELRFGGQAGITIPAGAPALSDPVELAIPAQADLAVSLYLPGASQATTIHNNAYQTSYLSTEGDYASALGLPVARSFSYWPFLTEIDVEAPVPSIVVLGDSLTDGVGSPANSNRRWTDYLARRLQAALGAAGRIGVVNRGLSANLLLNDYATALTAGRDSLERFDRDVLATAGVRYLMVLIGINDICYSNGSNPIPVAELIAGWRQIIARARARDLVVIGATLPPFAGFTYYTQAREAVRVAANNWMRSSAEFDALADVELALRDPQNPARLLPRYDTYGDHLHPNDLGYEAMANAVPLAPFVSASAATETGFA